MGVSALVKNILHQAGIESRRFSLQWASAAEAPRFIKLVTTFTDQIREIGPLGQSEGLVPAEARERVGQAVALLKDARFRIRFGKIARSLRQMGGGATEERIAGLIDQELGRAIAAGLEINRV